MNLAFYPFEQLAPLLGAIPRPGGLAGAEPVDNHRALLNHVDRTRAILERVVLLGHHEGDRPNLYFHSRFTGLILQHVLLSIYPANLHRTCVDIVPDSHAT